MATMPGHPPHDAEVPPGEGIPAAPRSRESLEQRIRELEAALAQRPDRPEHASGLPASLRIAPDGKITHANEFALYMLRLDRSHLGQITVEDLGETPRHSEVLGRLLLEPKLTRPVSIRLKRMNGEGFDATVSVTRVVTQVGHAQGWSVTIRDRAPGDSMFRLLLNSTRRYDQLYRHTSDGIVLVDSRGVILDLNPQAQEMWRFTNDSFQECTFHALVAADEYEASVRAFETVMRDSRGEFEMKMVRRDNTEFIAEVSASICTVNGETVVQALVRDVSRRHSAEQALEMSESRFHSLAENIDHVFWISELGTNRLLYLNPAYERVWGRTVAEAIKPSSRMFNHVHPEDRQRILNMVGAHRGTESLRLSYRIMRPDGQVRWIRDTVVVLRDRDDVPYRLAGIAEDVTEQRSADLELRERSELIQTLFTELDHRVRNTLMSLLTLIDMTRASHGSVDAYADAIRARVAAATRVHAMLSESQWRPVPMSRLLETMCPPGTPGRCTFAGSPAAIPPLQLNAMGMMLHELFTNSLKHGALSVDTGVVTVAWHVAPRDDGTTWLLINWQERGGPAIESEPTRGTGSELLEGLVTFDLRGELSLTYPQDGALHDLKVSLLTTSDANLQAANRVVPMETL
ncbi:MAG: PAS domain S-box protein [Planctomycetota bacterium]